MTVKELKTTWLKIDPDKFEIINLKPAVNVLKKGGIIVYPTETVYGLGANIFHQKAIQQIFRIKRRDPHKPISAMIPGTEFVDEICTQIPDYARQLMARYWPGPLTLILKASQNVPIYMTSSDRKIGIRYPDHPITKALMIHHRQPITSTSANRTGANAPSVASELSDAIKNEIDLVVDSGPCLVKIPSTVIDCTDQGPKLLRQGTISFTEIQSAIEGYI